MDDAEDVEQLIALLTARIEKYIAQKPRRTKLQPRPAGRPNAWAAPAILLVIDAKDDDRSEAAALLWAHRLAIETPNLQLPHHFSPLPQPWFCAGLILAATSQSNSSPSTSSEPSPTTER